MTDPTEAAESIARTVPEIAIAQAVITAQDEAGQPLHPYDLTLTIEAAIRDAGYRLVPLSDLPDRARARNGDPETSHAAAQSASPLNGKHDAVLKAFALLGGSATDEQWIECYMSAYTYLPRQSRSGLRTRRAELVAAGLVRATGEMRLMASGRKAQVWEAVG